MKMDDDDIAEENINRAVRAFGEEVAAQSEARKNYVISRLRQEMAKLRPHAKRLLTGRD